MNNNFVSVIVPIYNVAQYLDECISTIVHQTYKELQIILVDDGSSDNCPKKCDEWAKRDTRIEVIHKQNGGLSDARNAGLKRATGKYVFFVDSDDLVNINTIEVLVRAMNKYHVDMVVYRYAEIFIDHRIVASTPFSANAKIIDRKGYLSLALEDNLITNHVWRRLFKRSNIPMDVFPKGQNFEDLYAIPDLAKKSSKILLLNFVGYYYRENNKGIAKTINYKRCKDFFLSLKHSTKGVSELEPALKDKANASDILHDIVILRDLNQVYKKDKRAKWLRNRILAHINKQKKETNNLAKYIKNVTQKIKLEIKDPWLINKKWTHTTFQLLKQIRDKGKNLIQRKKQYFILNNQFNHRVFKKNFVILGIPDYGNLGDQALRLGENIFLTKYFKGYEPFEITTSNLSNATVIKKYLNNKDYISLHAGGNIGTLYPGIHQRQERILSKFKNNKLFIFPQTFYYSHDEVGKKALKKTRKVYDHCKDFHVFARDENSYNLLKKNMPEIKSDLMPDMALMLHYKKNYSRHSALLLLRLDSEKTLTWQDENQIFSVVESKFGTDITQSDTHIYIDNLSIEQYEDAVFAKLKQIASSQLVITDRLHGMIFSVITRTPCILLPSKSPKIKGVYQWVKQNKYIKLIDNIQDLPKAIDEVLAADNSVFDRGIIDQKFAEMAKIIKSM